MADVGAAPGDYAKWLGNSEADRLAKLGASLHETEPEDLANYKSAKDNIKRLANYMVDVLYEDISDTTRHRRKLPLLPKGARPISTSGNTDHSFIWQNTMWICTSCLVRTNCPVSSVVAKSKCNGKSCFSNLLEDPHGHVLCSVCIHGGGIMLYCTRCWAYCQSKPVRLSQQCDGVGGPYAKTAKRYIQRGIHPTTIRQLFGMVKMK